MYLTFITEVTRNRTLDVFATKRGLFADPLRSQETIKAALFLYQYQNKEPEVKMSYVSIYERENWS